MRAQRGCVRISLFGGIEAGRRACDLLGFHLVRHIAVENNADAIRAANAAAAAAAASKGKKTN